MRSKPCSPRLWSTRCRRVSLRWFRSAAAQWRTCWLVGERVERGVMVEDPYLALDVLGTEVEDEASGFKGKAVASVLHINGCLHIDVQPSGILEETGTRIEPQNFDIRRLKGKAIK